MLKKLRKHKKTKTTPAPDPAATANHGESASVLIGTGGRRRLLTKKRRLILLAAVAILLVAGGGVYWWARSKKPAAPTATTEGVELKKLDEQNLQTEVDRLVFEKKYDSADQLIKHQDNASDPRIQLQLATVYINQGKHQEALQVFLDIEKKHGEDWQVAKYTGQQYQVLGDKQKAREYYQKALRLVREAPDVPLRDDEILYLEAHIQSLEGA